MATDRWIGVRRQLVGPDGLERRHSRRRGRHGAAEQSAQRSLYGPPRRERGSYAVDTAPKQDVPGSAEARCDVGRAKLHRPPMSPWDILLGGIEPQS
jgi:hypothetical protein